MSQAEYSEISDKVYAKTHKKNNRIREDDY